ncbi:MAG: Methicillin resistance protein [Parcubacteria group bacterium GW2011_GWA2_56_7]|nr:MAG: Methicillin resistance protein [Parcubacteria group bacterium GW2011_GWA2_56_7]
MTDREVWNHFVIQYAPRSGAFLQQWEVGSWGSGVERVGIYEDDVLTAVAIVEMRRFPLGLSYTLTQRGPVVKDGTDLQRVVETIGREFPVTFVRFEPESALSWAKRTIHVSPDATLILDLTKSEHELLADMHPKTRYNIRLADKKGVALRDLRSDERETARELFEETARRGAFRLHPWHHYERWLNTVSGARLVGAFYGGELLAVNLMIDFAGTRTYLHGASSNTRRDVMAPHALHWHEIQNAKAAGLTSYDFWGISDSLPEWKGITRFKRGFGGEELSHPGTFDAVQQPMRYWLYRLLRSIRRGI